MKKIVTDVPFFITSNTNFFHSTLLENQTRPFKNIDEMNKFIIDAWNYLVDENDKVIFLGDFSFGGKYMKNQILNIYHQLNGKKLFMKGELDEYTSDYIEFVDEDIAIKYKGHNLYLSHLPPKKRLKNVHYFHGHHNNKCKPGYHNVCLDQNNFMPFFIDEFF